MDLFEKDIHSHLLPGVDDGFRDAASSVAAIRKLAEAGCRELTFTPHFNPEVYPEMTEAGLRAVYDGFVPQIPTELGVTTHLAAEYMVVPDFEKRIGKGEGLLTFGDGSILIEMSYYFRSANFEAVLFELSMAGLRPILAHPERYSYMSQSLRDFERWRDMGCRFQMNYLSLTGKYGPESVKILKHLLAEGFCDFVATDLHSVAQLDTILGTKPVLAVRRAFRVFKSSCFPEKTLYWKQ